MPLLNYAGEEPVPAAMHTGRLPRCYPIYLDFSACMRVSKTPVPCEDFKHDYFECLHHTEEVTRIRQIEAQKSKIGG